MERRRTNRKVEAPVILRLQMPDGLGQSRWVTADLREKSDHGVGIAAATPLPVGSKIMVRGRIGDDKTESILPAQVQWCSENPQGGFHAGLELLTEAGQDRPKHAKREQEAPSAAPGPKVDLDCYEVMQLSPNADTETIDRVYRYLAKRWHPDNTASGNADLFLQLNQAYDVLKDPMRRAAYDASYHDSKRLQWNIFDQTKTVGGAEGEKRKRDGILGLLYAKMLHDPDRAALSILEFEQLLGCPREHLQTALWYLRGKNFIQRTDSGRYTATVAGFEEAEHALQSSSAAPLKMIKAR